MIRTFGIGDDGLIVAVFKLHERCRVVVYVYRVYTRRERNSIMKKERNSKKKKKRHATCVLFRRSVVFLGENSQTNELLLLFSSP